LVRRGFKNIYIIANDSRVNVFSLIVIPKNYIKELAFENCLFKYSNRKKKIIIKSKKKNKKQIKNKK
jgi:hypothetical protein